MTTSIAKSMAVRALPLAGLLLFAAGCGCSGDAPADEPALDPVARRMNDPVYLKKIDEQLEERRRIMKAMAEAKGRLDAAKAAGASEEELARLTAELEAAKKAFKVNKAASALLVRERMLRDQPAAGANAR